MQRIIRMVMLVMSVAGVITALMRRFGPRVREYGVASQTFWSDPKVIKAREKAWQRAHRAMQAHAKAARA